MKPILLCILDGVGINKDEYGNAFKQAYTPNIDCLWNRYPNCKLNASGEHVGLAKGLMGNSEVGHTNIGAGRIVYQPSEIINNEIKNGQFYENIRLNNFLREVKENDGRLHLMGLMSDAGVHSIINHLFSILDVIKKYDIKKVYIHGISDGRDTPIDSGIKYFDQLQKKLNDTKLGKISTISGRFYAMDRDNRWDRIKKAYECITLGIGKEYDDYTKVFENNYERGIFDEFIEPCVIEKDGLIRNNDYLINFNFRPDRLRELLSALSNTNFNEFDNVNTKVKLLTMMPVPEEVVCENIYIKDEINNTLGEYLSDIGKRQLRIAETEKYAHVTYFFDGGKELNLKNSKRILVPSPKVKTYDLSPAMSCKEITKNLINELGNNEYDFIVVNYANGDMLGHTGNIEKTIESLEIMDSCIKKVFDRVEEKDGLMIITADHGNCEEMLNEEGNILTSHTTNKVPFIICNSNYKLVDGKLADIAPTILKIMNVDIPNEMTGKILIDD